MYTLLSGSRLEFSTIYQEWVIIDIDGDITLVSEKPWFALLLMPGFPVSSVIKVALKSRSPRYTAGALKWQKALAKR